MAKIYRGGKETVFLELKNICLENPARGRDLFPEFVCQKKLLRKGNKKAGDYMEREMSSFYGHTPQTQRSKLREGSLGCRCVLTENRQFWHGKI